MSVSRFEKLLAIDTAGKMLRLAVSFGDDRLVQLSEEVDRAHGQVLIKKIEYLLSSAGITVSELDGFVVQVGPGSFTGLRIGLATAKGMAIAASIPVMPVSLFELAAPQLDESGLTSLVVPLNANEWAVARFAEGKFTQVPYVVTLDELRLLTDSEQIVGISSDTTTVWPIFESGSFRILSYEPSDLLYAGKTKFLSVPVPELASLEPLYIVPSTPERKLAQQSRKS